MKIGSIIKEIGGRTCYIYDCGACMLEMNPGNHFKEPDIRTARGFAWLLTR